MLSSLHRREPFTPLSLVTRWQHNECHWKPQVGSKWILPRLSEGWLASPVTFVVTNFQLCGTVVCVWSTPAAWGQHRFVHRMGWLQSKQSDMSAWKTNLSSTNQLETSLAQYQGGDARNWPRSVNFERTMGPKNSKLFCNKIMLVQSTSKYT